jgi:glyoxylate carboligase
MAYATKEELANALNDPRLATTQPELLDACLDAAATEIDGNIDRTTPLPDPAPAIIVRTNVNRAAEWYKAADAANGGVGFAQTGVLTAPATGFERHAAALTPVTEQWGIG